MLQYVLSFVSGKDQGREFPLPSDLNIVIGRVSDADLLLLDEKVSRKHARISTRDGKVEIQDLGSKNGTVVNGKPVKAAELHEGDEILIGSSTIKLVPVSEPRSMSLAPDLHGKAVLAAATMSQKRAPSMSGSIEEVPLTELLQLLVNARKSGVLVLRSGETAGRIYLREGHIFHATIEGKPIVQPYKALYRVFGWLKGTFELRPAEEFAVEEEIKESTTSLMLEGMRHLDEMRILEAKLPPLEARLVVAATLPDHMRDLATEEIHIFQLALHHGFVEPVVDYFPGSDLEAYTCLLGLMRRGLVNAART